jgi:serine protease
MNVIVVGAIARDGRIAAYSNVGANIDLTAPGGDDPVPEDLLNNPPNGILTLSNLGTTSVGSDAWAVIQGTSFSAAQVSGVASLMFAVNPALTPGLLETVLKGSTRVFPDASCDTSLCGTGVLDASAALAGAANPTSVVGINANTSGGGGGCMLSAETRAFDPSLWLLAVLAGGVAACRRSRC